MFWFDHFCTITIVLALQNNVGIDLPQSAFPATGGMLSFLTSTLTRDSEEIRASLTALNGFKVI